MTGMRPYSGGVATASRPGLRLRDAFLGTIAAGTLSLVFGGPALAGPDVCTISGGNTIETCTGDQSAGISITGPTTLSTLNVNNLTTATAPASGTSGISFSSTGAVTITSNTGAFGITTGGNNASGIFATSSGAIAVTSIGNISIAGDNANGIFGSSSGMVTLTSTGNITTGGNNTDGINGFGTGAGAVTVTSTGNVGTLGTNADGISATTSGAVTVTSAGNITTAGAGASGILSRSDAAALTVTSTGNISIAGDNANGIFGSSSGVVNLTSIGNITTAGINTDGINGFGTGAGAVTVTSTGNIGTLGTNAYGISATSSGVVTVTSTGNITTAGAGASGIFGRSDTAALTVTSTGNISIAGDNANGIYGSSSGAVSLTSIGNITTAGINTDGINGFGTGAGAVTVASTGNISTLGANAYGISAASSGAVTVSSTGNITTTGVGASGIFSRSTGAVTLTSSGNIAAQGNNAYGIYGLSTGGPIAITIKSGTVFGGTGTAAGVDFVGGTNNMLTNLGTVTALSGLAIQGDTGNNTVNNFGTVIGNVILGTGANAFNNLAGGLFNAGTTVNLGAGNTLTNAGTLSPGGAGVMQTTAITGNLVQSATGRLFTDINIGGATSDRINVSGTANLAGAVQLQLSNPIAGPWQQTILSAAGGATNNGLTLLASPVLQAKIVYPDATDVVIKSAGLNFAVAGLNNNQNAIGNALNRAAQTSGVGSPIFNALVNGVTSLPAYGLALTQLSGEAATGTQQATFDAMNLFMGLLTDPFMKRSGGAGSSPGDASAHPATDAFAMFSKAPPASFVQRWSIWAAGYGGSQSTNGNVVVGLNNTTSSVYGTVAGADYLFSPNTIVGFALAGGGTNFSVFNSGSGRSDLFQAGAYVRHTEGAAYISAALAYGWQDITTNRTVTAAGLDQLRAEFNANTYSGRVEGGYRFAAFWTSGVGITPYAAGQFTTFDLPSYAEQVLSGTGAFALAYNAKEVTDSRSELGFRTDKSWAMSNGVLTLRSRFAWAHDFDPDRSIVASFQALPGAGLVVNGAAQARDAALTTASAEMKWTNGWSVAVTFEGEFSNVTASYAGKGVIRYRW